MSAPATAKTDKETGRRGYPFPPTGETFASVTTILDSTEGKQQFLTPWAARKAAERCVDDIETIVRIIAEHGRDAAVEYAKTAAKEERDLKADVGSYVHKVAEAVILWGASPDRDGAEIVLPELPEHLAGRFYDEDEDGEGIPVEDVADAMIDGFMNFIDDWHPEFEASEMTVFNPALKYAGTLDIIARLPGVVPGPGGRFIAGPGTMPCIDVKTGKIGVTWREQVAGYRRAKWALMPMGQIVPMPATDCGCVLHLRPEYERGYRLTLISGKDDAEAWNCFRRAVEVYRSRSGRPAKPGKVCYPPREDGSIPAPLLADLDGEGWGRALSPLMKAGVRDLEQLAAMTAGQLLATKGIGGKTVESARAMLAAHGLGLAGESITTGEAA